jgi:hypothetical protein
LEGAGHYCRTCEKILKLGTGIFTDLENIFYIMLFCFIKAWTNEICLFILSTIYRSLKSLIFSEKGCNFRIKDKCVPLLGNGTALAKI